jgi:hypothetical protein
MSESGEAEVQRLLEVLSSEREVADREELRRALIELLRGETPGEGEEYVAQLRELHRRYSSTESFSPGELVQWKDRLRNKSRPNYGEPIIVVEQLKEPVYDTSKDAGSAYFREPLDLIAGLIDQDNDFVIYYFDSRRFERFPQ